MTQIIFTLIFFILTHFAFSLKERLQKISDINVLMPICESLNCNKVYYTVHAEGGCYEWSVDQPGFIELTQLQSKEEANGCHHKVVISPLNNKVMNQVVWLIAKDKKSNEQFTCKVGFGKVTKLIITKKFTRMNLGEIAKIDVDAFDEGGNLFSSVKGFRFHWRISDGNSVHLLKLSQEKVKVGQRRLEVERKYHSDIILLKGINTGRVTLTAEILEPDYQGISSDERSLYVIEPFSIYPADPLYILPNNKFNFDLELARMKFVIPQNRKFYFWYMGDNTCGSVKDFGEYESTDLICKTRIFANDTRIDNFNSASNMIHVVHPTALDLALIEISSVDANYLFFSKFATNDIEKINLFKEIEIRYKNEFDNSNNWKLVEGRYYIIKNILMHERHPINYSLHTIKYEINISFLRDYIQDLICFHGNEVCLMRTLKVTDDYFSMGSTVQPNFGVDKVYTILKNIKIFPQVKIENFGREYFSLPYIPASKNNTGNDTLVNSQELRLVVNGGTGNYVFNSENSEVIQIREEILYGRFVGKTKVKVIDSEIPNNFDYIMMHVKEVNDFNYFEERQEIELGSEFFINPIAIKQYPENDPFSFNFLTSDVFTNCTNLQLNPNLSLKDKNLKQIPTTRESNFAGVRKFLQENRNLLIQKLNILKIDFKDEENLDFRYLDYINYGICESRGFIADDEGLVRIAFFLNNKGKETKVSSSSTANVYVYSPISLISPKFSDILTQELLYKADIADPYKTKNFILAVGSGVIVKFAGGIIPWAEFQYDYQEFTHISESSHNRTISIDSVRDKIKIKSFGIKEMYIECLAEDFEKEIVVTITNKQDKTLARPGKSLVSLIIGCYLPKSLSIFFVGSNLYSQNSNLINEESFINEVFSVPQKNGIEYYEKKASAEIARVYAFDNNKRIFYNITSLTGSWSTDNSDKSLYTLLSEKEFQNYIKSDNKYVPHDKLISPEYIHSCILFANQVAKFKLIYSTKNKMTHFVSINLIDFPILTPSNMTIYLSPFNVAEISLSNGSGDFDITLSDDSLAKFEYSDLDRKILLRPTHEGILYLYVKDKRIHHNIIASCTIFISSIKRIELLGGRLLMVNKTTSLNLKIYDNFENLFPFSQLNKMKLAIGDFAHVSKGLAISFVLDKLDMFPEITLTGLIADTYAIYVQDLNSNVTSNTIRLEVFDKLEVFPPYLLMIPGSSYTVSIRGGPINEEHILKRFEIIDSQIASVNSNDPEVKAHIIGKTVLKIIIFLNPDYNKFYLTKEKSHDKFEYVLATEEVSVTVDFPDQVNIRGSVNRKIYTKSTIRLYAALKLGGETFTYGTGPFNFDWSLDNTLLAKLRFYKTNREECEKSDNISENDLETCTKQNKSPKMSYHNINPYNSLGVFLSTVGQGSIEVKLTVTINYPDPYKFRKPNIFIKKEKILIQDEIYVDIPEFYENIPNRSGLYLIPLDIDHELHTNKNNNYNKYSVISQHGAESNAKENVISLSDTGRVTTSFQTGMAHVLINQRIKENPAFIPVILPIFVTDFYSLFASRSYQLIDMEVGQEIVINIILQHEYGILFADGKFERFSLRSVESHPRVVKAELIEHNSKIRIRANSKGEANIILFHPKTVQILDVFQVSVFSSLILPEKIYLNMGGTVNFLKKDERRKLYLSQDSEWISDDESIIKIDKLEGKATALREGVTNIHLVSKDRSKVKLSTSLNVVKVKNINIDRSNLPQYLTDIKTSPFYQMEYIVPINFLAEEATELSLDSYDLLNEIRQNLNFKCISDQPEVFTAQEKIEENSGKNQCIIRIREIPYDLQSPSNLKLIITVESKGEKWQESLTYRTSFKLPFMSSFKLKNKITHINFVRGNRTQIIYVDNLKDVSVTLEDESFIRTEVNSEDGYIRVYVPHDVDRNFNDIKLILHNKFTNQRDEILISYEHNHENEGERILFGIMKRETLIDFITLLVLIVTITILYSYISKSSEDRKRIIPGPNVSATRPPHGSGITSTFNMNK